MKLEVISRSSVEDMQKYVKLDCIADFVFCNSNISMILYLRQDDALFVRVCDSTEQKIFWFKVVDFKTLNLMSFRHRLIMEYFHFLNYYRDCVIKDLACPFDLPF